MSYRLTEILKWSDSWFGGMKPLHKLLFIYLCENCNAAGFIEYLPRIWAAQINCTLAEIEGGLKGVQRGIVISKDGDAIYIRNFLKHQKNYPFNENNKAHIAIIKTFESYRYKFDIQDINEFIINNMQGGSMGVLTPTGIGNGIGNGIGKEKKAPKIEKKFIAPTVEQVIEYFKLNGYPDELAVRFFKGYNEADWIDSHGNKVINWKQKAQMVWFKESNKYQHTQTQNNSPPQSTNKAQQIIDNNKKVLNDFLIDIQNGKWGSTEMPGEGDAGKLLSS